MKKTVLHIFLFLICLSGCSLFSSNENNEENKTTLPSGEAGYEEFTGDSSEVGLDPEGESSEDGNMSTEEGFANDTQVDEYADDEYADDKMDVNNIGEGELPTSPMTDNQEKDLFASQSGSSFSDSFSSSNQINSMMGEPKKLIPVKKMKSSVYQRSGVNINRLYVVRSGDNMESIARKIYGDNRRSEDIYSYNPHFRGKVLNVGDKIYYQSPHNPNDSAMKTYYEDNNLQPQYYVTQESDNLRRFSRKLLGHKRSWMEIYATNENIESKGRLPAGLRIRYWPDSGMKIAENPNPSNFNTPPEPPPESQPQPDEPPPVENQDQQMAMDQNQEPQPVENIEDIDNMEEPLAQTGNMNPDSQTNDENLPPPSAVPEGINQPSIEPAVSSPPSAKKPVVSTKKDLKKFTEDQKLMVALCGLMFLVAIILLILIRRNRSRKVNFGHTQS